MPEILTKEGARERLAGVIWIETGLVGDTSITNITNALCNYEEQLLREVRDLIAVAISDHKSFCRAGLPKEADAIGRDVEPPLRPPLKNPNYPSLQDPEGAK